MRRHDGSSRPARRAIIAGTVEPRVLELWSAVTATRWRRQVGAVRDLALRANLLRHELQAGDAPVVAGALRETFRKVLAGDRAAHRVIGSFVPALSHAQSDQPRTALLWFVTRNEWDDLRDCLGCGPRLGPAGDAATPEEAEPRVPRDPASDRPLTLGERKALARKPNQIARLLRDPDPSVVAILLDNPGLTEDTVLRIAASDKASANVVRVVAAHPRWCARARVRLALVHNPATPGYVAAPLVCLLPRPEAYRLLESRGVTPIIARAARRRLAM